jgi:hypothetical protein
LEKLRKSAKTPVYIANVAANSNLATTVRVEKRRKAAAITMIMMMMIMVTCC